MGSIFNMRFAELLGQRIQSSCPLSLQMHAAYLIEVVQDSWIQLHIKPVKVPTINNDLRQKVFLKKGPIIWK